MLTRHARYLCHIHVLVIRDVFLPIYRCVDGVQRSYPSAIQPEKIHPAIARHQLFYLFVGIVLKALPAIGVFVRIIIHIPVLRREIRPPVLFTVPVGLGEISPDHKIFFPESIEDLLSHIAARVGREGGFGGCDLIVRLLRIKHTETVMMLGGEDHVFHARRFGGSRPFRRIKVGGIESGLQVLIRFQVIIIISAIRSATHRPSLIFGTDAPAFHDAPLTICTPVHEQAEFAVLPLRQLLPHQRISGRHIGPVVIGLPELVADILCLQPALEIRPAAFFLRAPQHFA